MFNRCFSQVSDVISLWNTLAVIFRPIGSFLYLYFPNGVTIAKNLCTCLHIKIPQYSMIWSIAVENYILPQVYRSCLIVRMGFELRFITWLRQHKLLTTQIAFPFFGIPKVGDAQSISSYVLSNTPCLHMSSKDILNTFLYASGLEYGLP